MLPNFLIIGAMKSGTTSLFHYIGSHPHVFVPRAKELRFFTDGHREDNWRRGLSWYRSQFQGSDGAIAIGEASPAYSKYPEYRDVPARIASVLPHARLIYAIRHPIERMCSHFLHHALRGWERDPVDTALLTNPTYLHTSQYALQIERYLEHFPREQLLIVRTDDLRASPDATLDGVYRFLGIDPGWASTVAEQQLNRTEERDELPRRLIGAAQRTWNPWNNTRSRLTAVGAALRVGHASYMRFAPEPLRKLTHRHVDPSRAALSDGARRELEERLRHDVKKLRGYLGDDFDGWGIA